MEIENLVLLASGKIRANVAVVSITTNVCLLFYCLRLVGCLSVYRMISSDVLPGRFLLITKIECHWLTYIPLETGTGNQSCKITPTATATVAFGPLLTCITYIGYHTSIIAIVLALFSPRYAQSYDKASSL